MANTTILDTEERETLLELYEGLRVADIVNGLDYNGFHDIGRMLSDIGPVYCDTESFSHCFWVLHIQCA